MSDFVNNPRKTPRAAIGCDARVALKDGRYFEGPTVDCGPEGCQLTAPTPVPRDERIFVELKGEGVPETFWFSGRIAWSAQGPPYRLGVHFDAGSAGAARGFFSRLADAHPDAVDTSRAPERVASDAMVVPARDEADEALHPVEAEVMRAVGTGIRIDDLREKLGDRWDACLNSLFALLARNELRVQKSGRQDPGA
jgi:hypothetical protein